MDLDEITCIFKNYFPTFLLSKTNAIHFSDQHVLLSDYKIRSYTMSYISICVFHISLSFKSQPKLTKRSKLIKKFTC